jgi:hypothetical protein
MTLELHNKSWAYIDNERRGGGKAVRILQNAKFDLQFFKADGIYNRNDVLHIP